MKRVLMVSEAHGVGGAEIYLERLSRALPGWKVELAIPERPALAPWGERLARLGVSARAYRPGPGDGWRLARAARAGGFDLVHVNLPNTYDGGSGLLPWLLARGSGLPVVCTEHLVEIPRSRRRRWRKRALAGPVAATIVLTAAARRRLAAEGLDPGRIAVVPNGVPDPGPPVPMPPPSPLIVGVMASLEPRKQIEVVVQAAARLPEVPLEVRVAGRGPLRPALERLAGKLGQAGRVRFLGQVEDPDAFLDGVHLLALPSRLEGMPLVVLQAMARGRGALLSDLPGMDEVVADGVTGRRLPPLDVAAWTEALAAAAAGFETLRAWGAAARAGYEARFTLARSAAATAAVFDRAAAGAR